MAEVAEQSAPAVVSEEGPNGSIMVRLADSSEDVQETKPGEQTPELIGGKFKSQDDLLKAYQELEKKQGVAPKPEDGKVAPPEEAPVDAEGARVVAEQAGVDFDALTAEYQKDGALSEDTLKALEAKGISRQAVDNYVQGQVAIAERFTANLAESVGGADQLTAVLQWATTGLSKPEIEAYNAVVDTGNSAAAALALQGIHAKYTASVGKDPVLLKGTTVPSASGVVPYESNAEIVADMKKPAYRNDSAFRAKVAARLAVSNL